MRLIEALERIKSEKLISFHMPGHKNGRLIAPDFTTYDITEIPGSDHLHEAKSCLLETEEAISKFYSAEASKMLINGSTVGILAMILGLTRPGDRVLINRNAHKSVYNAIEMNQLIPVYFTPMIDADLGIPIDFDLENFKSKLKDVKVCLITYPTYEGVCFPIESMIDICHANHVPVLIDEAHGAHLLLHEKGPKSTLELGADVVVQSFHKTLPTLTQTACLHFGRNHQLKPEQIERINWYLKSLQSSSPSYVLMASVDYMLTFIEKQGKSFAIELERRTIDFLKRVSHLKTLKFKQYANQDITKLLLKIPTAFYIESEWDGRIIDKLLRETFGIQVEYSSDHYLLLMTSIATTDHDFEQLELALCAIEQMGIQKNMTNWKKQKPYERLDDHVCFEREIVYLASEMYDYEKESILASESVDRIACEYIIPYPPGIPLLVPGERISERDVKAIQKEQSHIYVLKKHALNKKKIK